MPARSRIFRIFLATLFPTKNNEHSRFSSIGRSSIRERNYIKKRGIPSSSSFRGMLRGIDERGEAGGKEIDGTRREEEEDSRGMRHEFV